MVAAAPGGRVAKHATLTRKTNGIVFRIPDRKRRSALQKRAFRRRGRQKKKTKSLDSISTFNVFFNNKKCRSVVMENRLEIVRKKTVTKQHCSQSEIQKIILSVFYNEMILNNRKLPLPWLSD